MEGFSINDIYETKGAEYLFVIAYLVILVIFWRLTRKPTRVFTQIRDAVTTLSAKILKIPQGIYFSKNHTWAHMAETGEAKVGVDDFLQHAVGDLQISELRVPGETIKKGELLAKIEQDGKQLEVFSPISGKVLTTNEIVATNPEAINADPYDQGWIYQVQPSNWTKDTSSCLLGDKANEWAEKEVTRFKDFLNLGAMKQYASEPSMHLLQDGGEIRDNVLSELPDDVWKNFQDEFLNG